MTLIRTFDATFLNEVVNHAEVRPWLGTDRVSRIELAPLLADSGNIALVNEHGGFVFVQRKPDCYEVHTQFLPEGRGRSAIMAAREAVRYVFQRAFAKVVTTDVPEDNLAALGLALKTGFVITGERQDDGAFSGKPQRILELTLSRERYFNVSAGWRTGTMEPQSVKEPAPCP